MKQLRIFSIFSCFAIILCLLIFSFSGTSIAGAKQEKRLKECISGCKNNGAVCINMTADSRRCAAVYQECDEACKAEYESSLSNSEGDESSSSKPAGNNSSSSTLK